MGDQKLEYTDAVSPVQGSDIAFSLAFLFTAELLFPHETEGKRLREAGSPRRGRSRAGLLGSGRHAPRPIASLQETRSADGPDTPGKNFSALANLAGDPCRLVRHAG